MKTAGAFHCGLQMAIVLTMVAGPASAGDVYWQAGDANWSGDGVWNPNEPGQFDVAHINNTGTAQVTQPGETCSWLVLAESAGQFGSVNVTSGDLNVPGVIEVGRYGSGTFFHSGGAVAVSFLNLAMEADSAGTYSYSGTGPLLVNADVLVGNKGMGTFTQAGGSITINGAMRLGSNVIGIGAYSLAADGWLHAADENIGYMGAGTFQHWSGTNTVDNALVIGSADPASSEWYDLQDGSVDVGSGLYLKWGGQFTQAGGTVSAPQEYLGYGGVGTYTHSGGRNTCTALYVGYQSNSIACTYTLSGDAELEADYVYVAREFVDTVCMFNQEGGTSTVAHDLYISQAGMYYLSSGALNVTGDITKPAWDTAGGNLVINGGTATVGGNVTLYGLLIGDSGGTGTFDWSGPGTVATAYLTVGDYGGTGTMTQTGGTVNVSFAFRLGNHGLGSEGTYDLSGTGQLLTAETVLGWEGFGTLNQTAGSHVVVGDFVVGECGVGQVNQSGGSASCATLYVGGLGSTYALSGTGTFTADEAHIGYDTDNACAFDQTGGACTISNDLYLYSTSGASYYLTGGTLTVGGDIAPAPGEAIGGNLSINGGTADVTGNIVVNGLAVGSMAGCVGQFDWSGDHEIAANFLTIADWGGAGTMAQTGGTVRVDAWLTMGGVLTSEGTYNLGGTGHLEARDEWLGKAGPATFHQTAGTHAVEDGLVLGVFDTASGAYQLDNGSLTVGGDLTVGQDGQGTFDQSGGTCRIDGTLFVAANPGASGAVILSGAGILNAATVQLNAGGSFTQAGGDLTFTTFNQDGGTVHGTLQNRGVFNYNSGTFNARLINEGVVNLAADFTAANGIDNRTLVEVPAGRTVTCNGTGLDNSGTITMGGTLAGDGPLVNNALIEGTGTIAGSAGFVNNGSLLPTGLMTLSNTGANANYGQIVLTPYRQLRLAGGALTNHGTLDLNQSLLAGPATLDNAAGGTIQGAGAIVCPFANTAGLLLVPAGTVNVVNNFDNGGIIRLTAATSVFTGGHLNNTGVVEGQGNVGNEATNAGTIEAIGGTLTLGGPLSNSVVGLMTAAAGTKIVVTGSLGDNEGTIHLAGGTFDAAGGALTSAGLISGYGTLRTGGLTNLGDLTLTGGASTVTGDLTNQASGQMRILYDPALFAGDVTNYGTVKVTDTTVTFAGTYTENGAYLSDPAENRFTDLVIGATGYLVGGAGDVWRVGGDLLNHSERATDWNTALAEMVLHGAGPHDVLLVGADLGPVPAGYAANFAWGTLRLEAGARAVLGDGNAVPGGALYLDSLDLSQSGVGVAKGADLNVYYRNGGAIKQLFHGDADLDGDVDLGDLSSLAFHWQTPAGATWAMGDCDGDADVDLADLSTLAFYWGSTTASPPAPEPGTLVLLGVGAVVTLRRRRGAAA